MANLHQSPWQLQQYQAAHLQRQYQQQHQQQRQQHQVSAALPDFSLFGPTTQLPLSEASLGFQQQLEINTRGQQKGRQIYPDMSQAATSMTYDNDFMASMANDTPLSMVESSFGSEGQLAFVSPQDLFLNSSFATSGSSAFTNLTTPDLDLDTLSFDQDITGLTGDSGRYTGSLFPEQPAFNSTDNTSATTMSPSTTNAAQQRLSISAGIAKSSKKRRTGPLKEISIDESDKVSAKRARNTLAARQSRERKAEMMERLEEEVEALKAELALKDAQMEDMKRLLLANGILQ